MRVLLLLCLSAGVVFSHTTIHPLGGVSYIEQQFYHSHPHQFFDSSQSGYHQFDEVLPGFHNQKNTLGKELFTPARDAPMFTEKQLEAYNTFYKELEDENRNGTNEFNFYNPYSPNFLN